MVNFLLSVLVNLVGKILIKNLQINIVFLFVLLAFIFAVVCTILICLVKISLMLLVVVLVDLGQQINDISHCLLRVRLLIVLLEHFDNVQATINPVVLLANNELLDLIHHYQLVARVIDGVQCVKIATHLCRLYEMLFNVISSPCCGWHIWLTVLILCLLALLILSVVGRALCNV